MLITNKLGLKNLNLPLIYLKEVIGQNQTQAFAVCFSLIMQFQWDFKCDDSCHFWDSL
uniref:Uncharacterized protein n=1 Tax=Tetranychus urticae TaxID=32264 RepID=T1JUN2_TETUR